ncbi:leukocyte receptor cluster member 1 homolog [Acanthaster planci]|uniref:Leukocyte receptor cluster member 1 homolog n=1 Tax=Acanthaster planci TaxID=133434 RepID=A0A8B7XQS0_ACAPL|nr:leukocyte receptor cluster member 1 homolog [Acanthaster planci]
MNILPKKSWHVRSLRNIERVKRDEARAADENKQRQERAALAEQEARTALLRRKARQLTSSDDSPPSGSVQDDRLALRASLDQGIQSLHVDLFSDLGSEKPKGEKNKEHEKEEKAAKEQYEKKIGLLAYLGQSSAEAQTAKPWYFKPPDRVAKTAASEEQSCMDVKRKASLDPMVEMEKYLKVKRPKGETSVPPIKSTMKDVHVVTSRIQAGFQVGVDSDVKSQSKELNISKASSDDRRSKHRSHKSKHKHKHRRDKDKSGKSKERRDKHQSRGDSKTKDVRKDPSRGGREATQGPSVQQLREERLRREAAERARTNRLLSGEKPEGGAQRDLVEEVDRPGRYNSQFHPELARSRHRQAHYGGT